MENDLQFLARGLVAHVDGIPLTDPDLTRLHELAGVEAPVPEPEPVYPSGEAPPVGDLPGWRQVFLDDFPQDVPLGSFPAAVADKWSAYPQTWKDTSGNGSYDAPRTISIKDGVMDIHVHTETVNGVARRCVAAPCPRLSVGQYTQYGINFAGQLYGRYAVRFRSDALDGYKVAWLLWPTSGVWPRDGEIDFPEGDLDGNITGFMHRQNGTAPNDQDGAWTTENFQEWHTAVIEWTPEVCKFILDGETILAETERIPNTPMRWVLQTETTLDGVTPDPTVAGHVQVDWVAAWERA